MADRGSDIKVGDVLELNSNLFLIVKKSHTQPGKGGAYVQAEMRNITTGSKQHERFRSDGEIKKVRLEENFYEYLFTEADMLTVMNRKTFEQKVIDIDLLGSKKVYLKDGITLTLAEYNDKVIYAKVPPTLKLTVIEADAVIKGQTISSSYKTAILENNMRISVPQFIKSGDVIIVNTEDDIYLERAKD